jgi:hypothetical protein
LGPLASPLALSRIADRSGFEVRQNIGFVAVVIPDCPTGRPGTMSTGLSKSCGPVFIGSGLAAMRPAGMAKFRAISAQTL